MAPDRLLACNITNDGAAGDLQRSWSPVTRTLLSYTEYFGYIVREISHFEQTVKARCCVVT